MKTLVALVLSLVLLAAYAPAPAFAVNEDIAGPGGAVLHVEVEIAIRGFAENYLKMDKPRSDAFVQEVGLLAQTLGIQLHDRHALASLLVLLAITKGAPCLFPGACLAP
jgi:hypothetical protein